MWRRGVLWGMLAGLVALSAGAERAPGTRTDAPAPATLTAADSPVQPRPSTPPSHTIRVKKRTLTLADASGTALLRFPATLRAGHNGRALRLRGAWTRQDDETYAARLEDDAVAVDLVIRTHRDAPQVSASIDVTYKKDTSVGYQTWTVSPLNVTGQMLDRAYRERRLRKRALFVDRWTPHRGQWVKTASGHAPAFALVGDSGVEAIRASSKKVVFELDHKHNHDHSIHESCYDTYEPDRDFTSVSNTKRSQGETTHHEVTWVLGEAHVPHPMRWPDGRSAALSIVDHADGANRHTLRALMYGSSRKGPSSRHVGGLVGHGVDITKTVFATSSQLGDPRFRALVDTLHAEGSEIAPHSLTPGTDSRANIKAGLDDHFAAYAPRSWVDHQPDTNCEALNNRGGRVGHRYNVISTLRERGVRYAWEAPDYLGWRGLNFFRPQKPAERVSFFYPAQALGPDAADMWLFRSAWLFLPHQKVTARFRTRALEAFEQEQGLFIAHTYFGATKSIDDADGRSLFERDKRGSLRIRRDYDRMFRRLGQRHAAGTLWVAPVQALGDWMQHWSQSSVAVLDATHIEVVQPTDAVTGEMSVQATGPASFREGAQVRVPADAGRVVLETSAPMYDASLRAVFGRGPERVARR